MVEAGRPGTVIFSSSLFGLRGGAGNAAYSASKFEIIRVAQSMAAELAPAGIRVNSVCPGQVDTEMICGLSRGKRDDGRGGTDGLRGPDPAGRVGSTAQIADTHVYLASELSSYVTGQHSWSWIVVVGPELLRKMCTTPATACLADPVGPVRRLSSPARPASSSTSRI